MIHNTSQISQQELEQLHHLASECKKKDGSIPNLYTHILIQERTFPASLLYYEKDRLIGFLSIYFFYGEAIEVSVLVHPAYRKQGVGKKLLEAMLELINCQNFFTLIFSSPTNLNTQKLLDWGYSYLHSEYYMERHELTPLLEYNTALSFRAANTHDIPYLCALDNLCFPQKQGDLTERFHQILNSREYDIMLAFKNNLLVGKAHLRWQEQGASLSDIAVTPTQQGQGLGSALISHCINYALSEGKPLLNLDVETHNQRALNLYVRLGFTVQNACDFWSIAVEKLALLTR